MSTRSSIYYRKPEFEGEPEIHIYHEMMRPLDDPARVRLEIDLPYITVNIALPKDLKEKLGI